jgi:hypothetical protein
VIHLSENIPKLYAQDGAEDSTVYAVLYHPFTHWVWFVTEREGDTLYTLCVGFETEWGYSSLSELQKNNVMNFAPWTPISLSKAKVLLLENEAIDVDEAA